MPFTVDHTEHALSLHTTSTALREGRDIADFVECNANGVVQGYEWNYPLKNLFCDWSVFHASLPSLACPSERRSPKGGGAEKDCARAGRQVKKCKGYHVYL